MFKHKSAVIAALLFSAIFLSGCTRSADRAIVSTNQPDVQKPADSKQALSPINIAGSSGTGKVILNSMDNTEISDDKVTSATFVTSQGNFTLTFYKKDSPKTVENFIKLAKAGFYDGTRFHRVIKDFMIQGGDPLSKDLAMRSRWGTGNPGYAFDDEFNNHKLVRGSLAMANSGPNSNGSQFFIVTAEATPWLDGKHTNFGEVTSGLDVVEKIGNVKTGSGDQPVEDVIIEKINLK